VPYPPHWQRADPLPPPPVDDEELVVTLGADGPEPDDREEALGLGADGLVREIERGTAILRLRGSCLRHLSARERSAGGMYSSRSGTAAGANQSHPMPIAPASPIVPAVTAIMIHFPSRQDRRHGIRPFAAASHHTTAKASGCSP